MFPSTPVDEIPESIPFITNNLNQYCNSQITLMLNKIANDYSLDISKLKSSCFEPVNIKLSNNIHYPAHNSSRCKARVWNGGRGGQCKRKQHEDGLCKIHYKKLLVCKNNNCENGVKGLGACKCGSNGNVNTTSTECVKITSITKGISIAVATSFAYQPESLFPKNQFSGSHCVFSLMIENGVYIFMTPAGGSY